MKNNVRTSKTMASIASHSMAGRLDDALLEMLVNNLLTPNDMDMLDELVKSLAASVLVNRKA